MKKISFVIMLVLSTVAVLAQTQSTQSQPTSSKVIKDQGEYNAYMSALSTTDPPQKAAAMMAFLQQYPSTIMKSEALEQARAAYQVAGNLQKLEEVSRLILKDNPDDLQSLALVTAIARSRGTPQSIAEARTDAEKGLQLLPSWSKPEGTSDADFEKVKTQMTIVFNGAAGFGALQAKDYAAAKDHYLKSIALNPNNLQDVYQLALADLNMTPINLEGFWYGAKAITLAAGNADAANGIARDIKYRYKKYHGTNADWDKFAATTVNQTAAPSADDLAKLIPPPPTPCDYAVDAVKKNKPEDLGFEDKEFVLAHANCSPANKEAADKVWQAILNKQKSPDGTSMKLKLPVVVISATKSTILAAITEENQHDKKADVTIVLEKPILRPPAPGAAIDVVGTLTKYDPEPFMFTMEQGAVPSGKPVATPSKRPVHHATNRKPARS